MSDVKKGPFIQQRRKNCGIKAKKKKKYRLTIQLLATLCCVRYIFIHKQRLEMKGCFGETFLIFFVRSLLKKNLRRNTFSCFVLLEISQPHMQISSQREHDKNMSVFVRSMCISQRKIVSNYCFKQFSNKYCLENIVIFDDIYYSSE